MTTQSNFNNEIKNNRKLSLVIGDDQQNNSQQQRTRRAKVTSLFLQNVIKGKLLKKDDDYYSLEIIKKFCIENASVPEAIALFELLLLFEQSINQ